MFPIKTTEFMDENTITFVGPDNKLNQIIATYKHLIDPYKVVIKKLPKVMIACCSYQNQEIAISIDDIFRMPAEELLETVLHEVAHKLEPSSGHGPR